MALAETAVRRRPAPMKTPHKHRTCRPAAAPTSQVLPGVTTARAPGARPPTRVVGAVLRLLGVAARPVAVTLSFGVLAQSATPLSPKAADPQLNRSALRRDPPARNGRTPSPQEKKPTAAERALPPDVAARLKIVADFHARARAAAAVVKAEPPPAAAAVISAAIVQLQEPAAAAARTSVSQPAGPSIAVTIKMDTLPFATDQMASDTSCEQMLPVAGAGDVTAASCPPAPPTARSVSLSPAAPDPIALAVARYLTTPITAGPDGVGAPAWSGTGDTSASSTGARGGRKKATPRRNPYA